MNIFYSKMEAVTDVLDSLDITLEEREMLMDNLIPMTKGDDLNYSVIVGYRGNVIWTADYPDGKLSEIETRKILKLGYNNISDMAMITLLAKVLHPTTAIVLTARIHNEKDAIAIKGIEHLLYNGSVFYAI